MYQVIIVLDETRGRSYYYSYVMGTDVVQGNISCDTLPPEQDINKAQAYYWDSEKLEWVYDAEKYAEIVAAEEAAQQEAAQQEAVRMAVPTNEELAYANMELAELISELSEGIAEIGTMVASNSERLDALEMMGGE